MSQPYTTGSSPPVVNFINVFRSNFSYKSLFSSYILALNKVLYEKCERTNVDEINTRCQFHPRKKRNFFVRMLFLCVCVTRKKLPKRCSYKKFVRRTLMKLTPVLLECYILFEYPQCGRVNKNCFTVLGNE